MTAPTDHLAAAREALDHAVGPLGVARAQVHATLALAEAAQTANLIAALDYGMVRPADLLALDHRAEITKRLWPTYQAAHPATPPVNEAQVEALAGLLWEYAQNPSGPGDTFDETNDAQRNRHRNRAARLLGTGRIAVTP